MAQWLLKNSSGIFDHAMSQPDDFKLIGSAENSFFLAECSTQPDGDFVVEFPQQFWGCFEFYWFPNGKKTLGLTNKTIALSAEVDSKSRRAIMYTAEQIDFRISMIRWIALNVWIPDKTRMLNLDNSTVQRLISDINGLTDDVSLKQYITTNLYYDL
jgi:hypothetical protein